MVDVPVVPSAHPKLATRARTRTNPLDPSKARRARNRHGGGLVPDPRRECARPGCEDGVPAAAERHSEAVHPFPIALVHVAGGDVNKTAGFLVADARGRVVGRVEGPTDGATPEIPNALSVRRSLLRWRRRFVPFDAIEAIDGRTRVIGLRVERAAIGAFL